MRHKSTPEELAEQREPRPVMYRRNIHGRFVNSLGEDVTERMLGSFPWKGNESGEEFEWRHNWTRFRNYYVDDSVLREEIRELIRSRFTHAVV